MAMRNGFFQINITNEMTYVRLFPAVDGGEPVSVEELRDYLTAKGFPIDVVLLKNVIDGMGNQPKDIKLSDKKAIPIPESLKIKISNDKMTVTGRFYPFSSAGSACTMEDIKSELAFHGIKNGIDENEISRFLHDKHYCTDYILARGLEPTSGEDASIEYFFNTNPNLKPKLNDDGTVDFFSLSAISQVKEGQILATLTREVPGEPGFNVVGDVLPPREVRKLTLKFGRNIEMTEDGLSIKSLVNGHASLVDDKVFVADVYEVSDVDTSTGNIDYNGNVCVLGNVKAGFVLKAQGDVEIRGVVEGALIDATGNVSIARGMNGMGKGAIIAGGNVVAKFLENTTVNAEGYVHAEAILHSKVSCKGDVDVTGKKGFITGGIVRSEGIVSAKTIGSTMGVDTEIEVGIDPTIKLRANSLNQQVMQKRNRYGQVEQVVLTITKKIKTGTQLTAEQIKYFKELSTEYQSLKQEIHDIEEQLFEIEDMLEGKGTDSYVKVQEFAYPNTKITISDVTTTLSKPVQHGRFVKDGADVRVKGY